LFPDKRLSLSLDGVRFLLLGSVALYTLFTPKPENPLGR